MSQPFDLNGQPVTVGVSIGIAVSSGDGSDADELLKNADLALHRAKAEGGSTYRFFEAGMDADMQARCKLQFDLRKALSNGEFELYYQPVVNLERNEICGLEACCAGTIPSAAGCLAGRVHSCRRGDRPHSADRRMGLAAGLRRCRHLAGAYQGGGEPFAGTVQEPQSGADGVRGARSLRACRQAAWNSRSQNRSCCTTTPPRVATLHQLRSLGVRIAMDDFGTGYSSLSYLRSFPFDKIKIDRCFVKDLSDDDGGSLAILRAVSNLGSSLGMATTAEGVETQEQVDKVRAEGCTEMQGFFFSPPRPIEEIERLFLQSGERAASAA